MYFHLQGTISDVSRIGPYVDEEIRVTSDLREEGVIKQAFRRSAGPGTYLIIEAASEKAARESLGRLPFISEGLMTFDYTEIYEV